jgi:hypothetical protein
MKYQLAILTIFAATSLTAQTNKIEPIPSPLPTGLTPAPGPLDFASRLKDGLKEPEVRAIMSRAPDRFVNGSDSRRVVDGDVAEVWDFPNQSSLVVVLKRKKVSRFTTASFDSVDTFVLEAGYHRVYDPASDTGGGSGNGDGVQRVANAINGFYLTYACPRAYRKPVIWMTAADVQLVQACNANGFMFFGAYVYTGGGGY